MAALNNCLVREIRKHQEAEQPKVRLMSNTRSLRTTRGKTMAAETALRTPQKAAARLDDAVLNGFRDRSRIRCPGNAILWKEDHVGFELIQLPACASCKSCSVPSSHIYAIFSVLPMSADGSASRIIKFASLPRSNVPIVFSIPSAAPDWVSKSPHSLVSPSRTFLDPVVKNV